MDIMAELEDRILTALAWLGDGPSGLEMAVSNLEEAAQIIRQEADL